LTTEKSYHNIPEKIEKMEIEKRENIVSGGKTG